MGCSGRGKGLRDVYLISFLALFLISLPLLELSRSACESFDLGGILSIGLLKGTEEVSELFLERGLRLRTLLALNFAKYLPVGALLFLLVRASWFSPIPFSLGLLLAHSAAILKAVVTVRHGT